MAEFEVGTLCFDITDKNRKGVISKELKDRKIAIRLFYPVEKETVEGLNTAPYFSERKKKAVCKAFYIPAVVFKNAKTDYYENVPMIEGEKFPLLLFSHGYNSYLESNSVLCTQIAASGYIVACVSHAFEAIENDYSDGSYDYYDKRINKIMYKNGPFKAIKEQNKIMKGNSGIEETAEKFNAFQKTHTPYLIERVPEWEKDMLSAYQAVKERFGTFLDLTNGFACSGHSLGGATAYALCLHNPEVVCGLNIDGALFGDYSGEVLKKPFYQFSCKENEKIESNVLLNREALVYTSCFEGMKHIAFTDIKFHTKIKMIAGVLEPEIMQKHLLAGHLFMLDRYLKGKEVEFPHSTDSSVKTEIHEL